MRICAWSFLIRPLLKVLNANKGRGDLRWKSSKCLCWRFSKRSSIQIRSRAIVISASNRALSTSKVCPRSFEGLQSILNRRHTEHTNSKPFEVEPSEKSKCWGSERGKIPNSPKTFSYWPNGAQLKGWETVTYGREWCFAIILYYWIQQQVDIDSALSQLLSHGYK